MTRISRATLVLALMTASPAMADTTVKNVTASGAPGTISTIKGYTSPDNKEVPAEAMFTPPLTRNNSSGTIASAGTSQVAIGANTARRGGYCQADPRNTDILVFSFSSFASTAMGATNDCILKRGGTCPLTAGSGVYQGPVSVASPTAGQAFNCSDFQ